MASYTVLVGLVDAAFLAATPINLSESVKDKKIFKKKWRGYEYWACYNDKQVESAANLVKILCDEYFIPLSVMTHNTKVDSEALESIVYKSNINKHYKDLNPSWDCLKFKNKIENERKH